MPAVGQEAVADDAGIARWRELALAIEQGVGSAIVGQERVIHLMNIALFARGHVLLEGDVGVGKTTLLRAFSRAVGGAYERVEGTIDLMPADLVYFTYIGEDGRPRVDPGPILRQGEALATFFFNEVNRARPQVHSLLLRVMAERQVTAFNKEWNFPHLIVYADRNRVEREETFELPAAARDRFLMEISVQTPSDDAVLSDLMFEPRFHDVDALIESVPEALVPYRQLNGIARQIQNSVHLATAMKAYLLKLWKALRAPASVGLTLDGVVMEEFIHGGGSPRGMSYLIRALRVEAWLKGRDYVIPEDVRSVFTEVVGHRMFFNPIYEHRRDELLAHYLDGVLARVAAP